MSYDEEGQHTESEHTVRFARYPLKNTIAVALRKPTSVIELHDATDSTSKGPVGTPSLTGRKGIEEAIDTIVEHENLHQVTGDVTKDTLIARQLDKPFIKALSHSKVTKAGYETLLNAYDDHLKEMGVSPIERAQRIGHGRELGKRLLD